MDAVNEKNDVVCHKPFTSSFAFVLFPFLFNSYNKKYSFFVKLSQTITWQGDNSHIVHGFDGLMGVLF